MYHKLDQSFISDQLLVSAAICCPISVIGISVKIQYRWNTSLNISMHK